MNKIVTLMAIGGCVAMIAPPVLAQAPAASAAPASAASVALPGDNMGTGMRMGPPPGGRRGPPPGGAAGGPPGSEPGSNAPAPSLALSLKAAEAAIDACKAQGLNIGVTVIGSDGEPRVGLAQDGASGGHIYTAVRKGLAALAFGIPSGKVSPTNPKVTAKMATMAGAIPLFTAQGKLIGAIAGSGAASSQDEKCAQVGADAIKGEL